MALRKSIYLSDKILEKLSSIAAEKSLYNKDGKPDYLQAVRYVLDAFELPKEDNKNDSLHEKLSNLEYMIEQIHVTMPHILYHARYSSLYCNYELRKSKISHPELLEFSGRSIKNVYQICGDFQTYQYQTIYTSSDNKNMNTMPIEKDKNKWKLN